MRIRGKIFYFIFISLIIISCRQRKEPPSSFIEIKKLDYPSASAIEYYDGKLYVMGDDAINMMVLDTNLNVSDSIALFSYPGKRIPKPIKHDIESICYRADSSKLLLIGSGSLTPYRDTAWMIAPVTKEKKSISLTQYFQFLKSKELKEINIEGAAVIKTGEIILSNRGHLGWPKNYLVFAGHPFLPEEGDNVIIPVTNEPDSSVFHGISGLTYASKSDALIMTVSTEATKSVHEDGAIGKSFIWVIKNISTITNVKELKPDKIIDLETIDPHFKGQKIESATIIEETKDILRLVLVADNDDGSSTIFKMSIKRD